MNAVIIGPLMFSSERISAIIALAAFLITASLIARYVHKHINDWSLKTIIVVLVCSRLVHVLKHLDGFASEPLRIFAIWQGGFAWEGLGLGLLAMMAILYRYEVKLAKWGLLCVSAAALAFGASHLFTRSDELIAPPTTQFQTLDGNAISLSNRAQPIVINLWATWCPPCRREMPMMADVAASISDVDFIFTNQGEAPSTIGAYLQQHSISLAFPALDPESALMRHYKIPGLPATLFIARDGTLIDSHLGEISRETFQSKIKNLKNQKAY